MKARGVGGGGSGRGAEGARHARVHEACCVDVVFDEVLNGSLQGCSVGRQGEAGNEGGAAEAGRLRAHSLASGGVEESALQVPCDAGGVPELRVRGGVMGGDFNDAPTSASAAPHDQGAMLDVWDCAAWGLLEVSCRDGQGNVARVPQVLGKCS